MKIEFPTQGNNQTNDKLNMAISHETSARIADETMGFSLDISGKDKDITAFGIGELDSFEDVAVKASTKNVALESKANAVMSNSMSAEDFAEYQKEGYSPSNMDVDELVTNLDKIKATLLESGVVIDGFTDNISNETLDKITGNPAISSMILKAFEQENVPVTEENATEVTQLVSTAATLSDPTEDAKKYMVLNNMIPSVQNFYMAQFSSGNETNRHASYYVDGTGYTTVKPQNTDWEMLKPQAEKIIENSGLEVNEKTVTEARWLVEKDIPLTKENLEKLEKLNSVVFPIKPNTVIETSAAAIADGLPVKSADLTENKSFIRKAVETKEDVISYVEAMPKDDIKNMRIIEEIRLHMTVEANLHLLKKGISVDTKNLEKLVDDLKQAEKEIYEPLLTNKDPKSGVKEEISESELERRIDLYRQTRITISEIKENPTEAAVLTNNSESEYTLSNVEKAGQRLKSNYEEAGRSYETMMTSPRADLGDSVRKAFRNIDDILEDIGVRVNEINEKAVRTLGYAEIEITQENIEEASKANTTIENVISLMTPAKTLSMIRNGENPLDTDIYKLNEILSQDEEKSDEKYSEFLWKLEKSGDITNEERAAFIGVYRLFRQIEKSDGKLVGNVLKQGDEMTLSNLLTASRNNRAQGMDYSIDDDFGYLEKLITYGESITDQILKGFRGNKTLEKEFIKEETEEVREAAKIEENVINALEKLDEPVSANNLLAMNQLMNSRGSAFGKIMKKAEQSEEKSGKLKEKAKKLVDEFTDKDKADMAYAEMSEAAMEFSKDEVEKAQNTVDLKEMGLIHKQLSIIKNLSKNSQYEVPVELNGKWTSINLKLIKDSEETGKVSITFDTEETGKVSAEFKISGSRVTGFAVSENNAGNDFIRSKENLVKEAANKINLNVEAIYYSQKADININGSYLSDIEENNSKTSDLYNFAKAFIGVLQTA